MKKRALNLRAKASRERPGIGTCCSKGSLQAPWCWVVGIVPALPTHLEFRVTVSSCRAGAPSRSERIHRCVSWGSSNRNNPAAGRRASAAFARWTVGRTAGLVGLRQPASPVRTRPHVRNPPASEGRGPVWRRATPAGLRLKSIRSKRQSARLWNAILPRHPRGCHSRPRSALSPGRNEVGSYPIRCPSSNPVKPYCD
jgi:hypothetical protein